MLDDREPLTTTVDEGAVAESAAVRCLIEGERAASAMHQLDGALSDERRNSQMTGSTLTLLDLRA